MIRTLIIEDEISGQELLKLNIRECFPECQILGVADNVADAVNDINKLKPELIFMDIQLKGGTGFDVLDRAEKYPCEVIFVTAYSNYAIRALKSRALDYILKPINRTEFKEAVKRVKNTLTQPPKEASFLTQSLSVKTASGTEYIKFKNILFFEAQGAYTKIHFLEHSVLSAKNIGEYEELLSESGFFRCHHSYLVNTVHIEKFSKSRNGIIYLTKNHEVPVSQRKMKGFIELLRALHKEVQA